MKQLHELTAGKCTVIAEYDGKQRTFNGTYAEDLNLVFYAMPSHYNVIGYEQNKGGINDESL